MFLLYIKCIKKSDKKNKKIYKNKLNTFGKDN